MISLAQPVMPPWRRPDSLAHCVSPIEESTRPIVGAIPWAILGAQRGAAS